MRLRNCQASLIVCAIAVMSSAAPYVNAKLVVSVLKASVATTTVASVMSPF